MLHGFNFNPDFLATSPSVLKSEQGKVDAIISKLWGETITPSEATSLNNLLRKTAQQIATKDRGGCVQM